LARHLFKRWDFVLERQSAMPPPIPVGFQPLRQRHKWPQVAFTALIVFVSVGLALHLLG
jgi:hypothetical protein